LTPGMLNKTRYDGFFTVDIIEKERERQKDAAYEHEMFPT